VFCDQLLFWIALFVLNDSLLIPYLPLGEFLVSAANYAKDHLPYLYKYWLGEEMIEEERWIGKNNNKVLEKKKLGGERIGRSNSDLEKGKGIRKSSKKGENRDRIERETREGFLRHSSHVLAPHSYTCGGTEVAFGKTGREATGDGSLLRDNKSSFFSFLFQLFVFILHLVLHCWDFFLRSSHLFFFVARISFFFLALLFLIPRRDLTAATRPRASGR
jgi:hypothetical protein